MQKREGTGDAVPGKEKKKGGLGGIYPYTSRSCGDMGRRAAVVFTRGGKKKKGTCPLFVKRPKGAAPERKRGWA